MEKMGGIGGLMGMLPGMGQIKKQVEGANLDEKMLCILRSLLISATSTPAPLATRFLREALSRSGFLRSAGVIDEISTTCRCSSPRWRRWAASAA
jgi:hypothetical protein